MIEFEKINLQNAKEGLCLYDIGVGSELHKLDWVVSAIAEIKDDHINSDGLYYTLEDIYQNLKKALELVDREIIFKLRETAKAE